MLDQSIILYSVGSGEIFGGSDPHRIVEKIQTNISCDITMKLDLSNRTLVMNANNKKIIIDGNIGDFQYSPIVILGDYKSEITLL